MLDLPLDLLIAREPTPVIADPGDHEHRREHKRFSHRGILLNEARWKV
jgi:hypothetical protein